MVDFHHLYISHIETIYPPLSLDDGVPDSILAATEIHLALRLPAALRAYYALAGNRADMNRSHNLLVAPEYLTIDNGMLIFYRENQSVVLWSIQCADATIDDPLVYVTENTVRFAWKSTLDTVSVFLTSMIYYQATLGGLPYVGIGEGKRADIATQLADWQPIVLGASFEHIEAFVQPGRVICVIPKDSNCDICAGANTRADFMAMTKLLNMQWDYCTLDDED